jgi:hypothetical protein
MPAVLPLGRGHEERNRALWGPEGIFPKPYIPGIRDKDMFHLEAERSIHLVQSVGKASSVQDV